MWRDQAPTGANDGRESLAAQPSSGGRSVLVARAERGNGHIRWNPLGVGSRIVGVRLKFAGVSTPLFTKEV